MSNYDVENYKSHEEKLIDASWIDDFEKDDKYYSRFYKEDVSYIKTQCIYVNNKNEIQCVKQDKYSMKMSNQLTKEELFNILIKNSYNNNKRYTLLSILKYNIDLEPTNVKLFLQKKFDKNHFLTQHTNIDSISFNKTIRMFKDLNHIFFIFCEKEDRHSKTKRVFFHSSPHRKTCKKIT
jgi:hypothetical protein